MILRDYQIELRRSIFAALRDHRSVLAQCPTGGGKTVIAADIIRAGVEAGRRCSFFVPRRELAYQSVKRLADFGVDAGLIMAGEPPNRVKRCQVATFDTLYARAMKRNKIELPPSDLVVGDEAHLTLAKTRKKIMDAYPGAKIIGLTATPARGDGKPLGNLYDHLVLSWSTRRMIDEGYLVDPRYFAPAAPDLAAARTGDGDFVVEDINRIMNQPTLVGDIVTNWLRIAPARKTVVFCCTIEHSLAVAREFRNAGIKAEHIDGEMVTDKRAEILDRFENGETQVLTNVFVASYGLDIPKIGCVILARPTKSLVLYLQMVGRGLRPVYEMDESLLVDQFGRKLAIESSSKPDVIVIDHTGTVDRLGFVDDDIPWTLAGKKDIKEEKERIKKEKGEPKEITCRQCNTVFKGSRICPNCGNEIISNGCPIPCYEADLVEVGKKANRTTSLEEKASFYSQALGYARSKGYKIGFARHLYKEKFGVMPPKELNSCVAQNPRELLTGYIKYRAMKRRFAGRGK